jgi:thioredoxin 1
MIILDDKNFDKEIEKTDLPILIDIYADWCGPCKSISPIVKEISEEYKDKLSVFKVNVDISQNIALRYNVMSIPTLIFLDKNKKLINQTNGLVSKDVIVRNIYEIIKS